MKRLSAVLLVILLLCSIGCIGMTGTVTKEITETARYEDFVLILGDAEYLEDRVVIHAVFTNNSEEPYYAASCFAVRAFQDDRQIPELYDINGEEAALIREIKDGESIEVAYVFELQGDSPVEVLVGEPTADQTTIGRRVYESNHE